MLISNVHYIHVHVNIIIICTLLLPQSLSLLELLRCFAENTLVEMIRLLFSDLSSVEDTPTEEVINNDVRLFIKYIFNCTCTKTFS